MQYANLIEITDLHKFTTRSNPSFNVTEIRHCSFIKAEGKVKQVRVLICLTYMFIYCFAAYRYRNLY